MGRSARTFSVVAVVVLFGLGLAPPPVRGAGVVAADHRLASEAGAEILARGGNSVDAAVATALASGVVQPSGSGLGGGGFAVVRNEKYPRGFVLDFREVAPAAATQDMFLDAEGGVQKGASTKSGRAVAVPSEGVGLWALLEKFGNLPASEVVAPAVRLASGGFEVGPHLSRSLTSSKDIEVTSWFFASGATIKEGQQFRNPALAKTLTQWAKTRGTYLNRGEGAKAVLRRVEAAGGILTAEDLADVRPVEREPVVVEYRGYTLITMPPPSSGGVALAQMLRVLEGYDLAALGHNSSDYLHLLIESMKHAYADRAHHLGDPDFVEVPVKPLLSDERRDAIRHAIWPGRTFDTAAYGKLVGPPKDAGTLHISVLDSGGTAVALTTTINTSFGSGLMVPELGFPLNNQMDDFSAAPGVPNAYGLVGDAANAIAPKKRPLSSMSPTVVLGPDGRVVMVIGASGGSQIISSVLQVTLNVIDFGMDPEEAVSAPRIHHQWLPDEVWVEPGIPLDVQRNLEARGHKLRLEETFSSVQLVVQSQEMEGAADPRKGGTAAGVR